MAETANAKISVIVPVYNSQKNLVACISSIQAQSLKDIEILIIDDGSTDDSLMIMHEIAKKDKRVIIFSKENGGQSTARNLGIDNARGDYIAFVDSDDLIKSDMLELLYKNMIKEDAQLSICGSEIIRNGIDISRRDYPFKKFVFNQKEALEMMLSERYVLFSVCDKLYDRELLADLRFEEGVIYENVLFPYEYLKKCNRIVCDMSLKKYVYLLKPESSIGKPFSEQRLFDIVARERLFDDVVYHERSLYQNALNIKLVGYLNMANRLCFEDKSIRKSFLTPIIKAVRENACEYLGCKHINKNKKIGVVLLCMGYPFYRLGLKVKGFESY